MQASLETHVEDPETADEGPALFEAILEPHRSLSPRGFVVLMTAIGIVSFTAGMAFMLAGAWPVLGFFGLDVLLIYIAFKVNFHSAKVYETLRLTESSLTVGRMRPDGELLTWKFQPYWLRIAIDDSLQAESRLIISSHGKSLTIGEFLTPDERFDLAETLKTELLKLRQPLRSVEA